ncbi:putative trypanothione synthetase [Trypanosoma theileri]|uniref:Putative trypanothione synthetase n=1 Tax=Trypanosoma theileri TaxID=67003 RepID=A0A1X0NYH5_9TRYP|nr:putative trypanothione synthetase [Trypanosoma theileri]ORC89269.1 putative trypanothione synthetase [Trypanosoma theileri]
MQWNNKEKKDLSSSSSSSSLSQQQQKEEKRVVPLHGICGYAPGGIPAYSNASSNTFTHEKHYHHNYFMGYKWQCVEFARRWLFYCKGLSLPQYDMAAHLIYLRHVKNIYIYIYWGISAMSFYSTRWKRTTRVG